MCFGKLLLVLSVLITLFAGSIQAAEDHHAMVRFWVENPADQEFMDQNHLRFVIEGGERGEYYDLVVRADEVAELQQAGSRVEVLHENLEQFYASRLEGRDGWGLYHTYSEALALMDSLHTLYPAVVSARWSIGQGHLGNDIWCFRVSDNPESDETDEPEVLFDGLHHANEIMGSEVTLMLAEYLALGYDAGDPEIVELLDEHEIYMVPIVNPDGMLYNEQIYPNGGATWRKNRRDNGNGTWGVDINRNYDFEWGCDYGSSGIPSDPTYRGPFAESEPEIQAICAFIDSREFVVRQSFHSSGNITLFPWGYTSDDTPDHDIFYEMASTMTLYNGYDFGQLGDPGVLYPVCGGSIDWDYGAQDRHDKVFGFTNELGTSQWPPETQRQPIFEDNIWPALYLIQMAGVLRGVTWIHAPLPFIAENSEAYQVVAIPQGYEDTPIDESSVVMQYRVDGGELTEIPMLPTGTPGEYGATIPAQPDGAVVEYFLSASDTEGRAGTSPREAPDAMHYFEVGTSFTHIMEEDRAWSVRDADDNATSGLWVRVDPLGTSAQPEDDHSDEGTHCWITGQHTAGQSDGYNDVDNGKTTLFSPVYDMTGAESVTFSYWKWYSNDQGNNPGADYWDVLLSNDGGQTWLDLEHTVISTNAWVNLAYDLVDYYPVPGQLQLKFVADDTSPGSLVEAGVDDFLIAGVFAPTGLDETPITMRVKLEQNFPNPFNPQTTIRFHLPQGDRVWLSIYDVKGQLIKVLLNGSIPAGDHGITWNGRDALGRHVSSGVYFAQLNTAGGENLSCRMVMMK